MNRFRSILFAAIVAFSSSTLAFGGEMQGPGRSDPPPPPPATATTEEEITSQSTVEGIQIVLQDLATGIFSQVLLTIY